MPERPDLRKIAADIRDAIANYPPDAMADILTYVFQAYVVEGAPVIQAAQPERVSDLEGLTFAELILALQTRLDVPELALFDVQAGRVNFRHGGEVIQVSLTPEQRRVAAQPPPAPAPEPAPQPEPRRVPVPGVTIEEAPRPRGLSIQAQGARTGATDSGSSPRRAEPTAPSATPAAPRPAVPQPPSGQAATPAQPAAGQPAAPGQRPAGARPADEPPADDAAARRFALLELD